MVSSNLDFRFVGSDDLRSRSQGEGTSPGAEIHLTVFTRLDWLRMSLLSDIITFNIALFATWAPL
jgi:hypothetical protein